MSVIELIKISNIEIETEKGERLTELELIEILQKVETTKDQVRYWKSQNKINKLVYFEKYLNENGILIEWTGSKSSYPNFYKIKKSA